MLAQEWNIQPRAAQCAATGEPFVKDQRVYSALYWRNGQYERIDLCQAAWEKNPETLEPISSWQGDYTPPPPPEPEALKKDDADVLLRKLMTENQPETRNARYILALMLERKKVLRNIDRQKQNGVTLLVYEHLATGDVWLIEDPGLKLRELTEVQTEVSALLSRAETEAVAKVTLDPTPAPEEPEPELFAP